jgi:phosphohistidine phosphatase
MQLFIVRHAIAEEAEPGQADTDRELTKEGKKKLKQVVEGLRELEITFSRVLTSPWLRAVETAKLLQPINEGVPLTTELLTKAPSAELLTVLAEGSDRTAIVGHEPWLGELVGWLAFGDTRHGEALDLKKGAVVWLDGHVIPGGMKLRALLPPKISSAAR